MAFLTTLLLALAIALPWIFCTTEEWLSFPRNGDSRSQSEDSSVNLRNYDSDVDDDYIRDQAAVHSPKFSNVVNPYVNHRTQVTFVDVKSDQKWAPVMKSLPNKPALVTLPVLCSEDEFTVTLPVGPLSQVKILNDYSNTLLPVVDAPEACGYLFNQGLNQTTLIVSFSGCHVSVQDGRHVLRVMYVNQNGNMDVATVSCKVRPDSPQLPDKNYRSRVPVIESTGCNIPHDLQLPCGFRDCPASVCQMMGCCVNIATSACYYPMDECTADRQFVFAIVNDAASVPLDLRTLVVPGHPNCVPVVVTEQAVVYKFSVNDCGTRSFKIGETEVFLAEVQTKLRVYKLNFGIISRDNPLRFIVECRYPKSGFVLASVGFMVMTPSLDLPTAQLTAEGRFGVELRIAEDETYSSFYPHDHQPLTLLLGKPVYLELHLKAPEPRAVILVNYCLAYPRSAGRAMVLIHEGCANPYDPTINILQSVSLSQNRHTRRFVIHAFQFMDTKTRRYLDEEIYFMCSTELCMPDEGLCEESCFDGLSAP
ncbi:zona pellucida sperm-binding protein 4-like [Osmerus mordax]|uniref:zona pellucida sperm-binding protein 4-like n=1 Tax=Osmerus mordax TaxID=8014 RepID=UPI0035109087